MIAYNATTLKQVSCSGNKKVTLTLPAGTYDFMAMFKRKADNIRGTCGIALVVAEQTKLDKDITLEFKATDATNHISFEAYKPNGDKCKIQTVKVINEDDDVETIESANVYSMAFENRAFLKERGEIFTRYTSSGAQKVIANEFSKAWDGESDADIWTNNVSDRYVFEQSRSMADDDAFYAVMLRSVGSKNGIVANRPQDYMPLIKGEIKRSPCAADCQFSSASNFGTWAFQAPYNRIPNVSFPSYHRSTAIHNLYLCVPMDGSVDMLHYGIQFRTEDYYDKEESQTYIITGPFMNVDSKLNQTYVYQNPNPNMDAREGGYKRNAIEPMNPALTYTPVQKKVVDGNSCPIAVGTIHQTFDEDYECDYPKFEYKYMGLNGEERQADLFFAQKSLKIDGKNFTAAEGDFSSWIDAWLEGGHKGSAFEYTTTTETAMVNNTKSKAVMTLRWKQDGQDNIPPSLTNLQFRNASGDLTHSFGVSDDVKITLTAADFVQKTTENYASGMLRYWYQPVEAECLVEYAPAGTSAFKTLQTSKLSTNIIPSFGHLYGSNISAADFAGKTGAYDIRITITDNAGNGQIQTVSPAFFIGNSSKVDDILNPDEEGTAVYYDLFGRKVANPSAGIYVKIVNGKATKVAIK